MLGTFPLRPSLDGRSLVTADGQPYFIAGEWVPTMVTQLSTADAELSYFAPRRRAGFNAAIIELACHQTAISSDFPAAWNGEQPYLLNTSGGAYDGTSGTALLDGSNLNEDYLTYFDQIMDIAERYDYLVALYVLAWGFEGSGTQGWWPDIENATNTTTTLASLGTTLANGFGAFRGLKTRKNLIIVVGSDSGDSNPVGLRPSAGGQAKARAMIDAMRTAGCSQLIYGDWRAPSLSTSQPGFDDLSQLNGIYTYGDVYPFEGVFTAGTQTYQQSRPSWQYVPTSASQGPTGSAGPPRAIPGFMKETMFENPNFSGAGLPRQLRYAHWWSILSGGTTGLFYGNDLVWSLIDGTWQANMASTGAADMTRLVAFIANTPGWQKLIPSEQVGVRRLVTSSNGTQAGAPTDYVSSAQSLDGSLALFYFPDSTGSTAQQSATLDLLGMAAPTRLRWWDPTSNRYTNVTLNGSYSQRPSSGIVVTTPAGGNSAGNGDWMLVADIPGPRASSEILVF